MLDQEQLPTKGDTAKRRRESGYGFEIGEFDMADSWPVNRADRQCSSKPAAPHVNHVSVLDISWSGRFTMDGRPQVHGLGELLPIDDPS